MLLSEPAMARRAALAPAPVAGRVIESLWNRLNVPPIRIDRQPVCYRRPDQGDTGVRPLMCKTG